MIWTLGQFQKAPSSTWQSLGIRTSVRLKQARKAQLPIFVTDGGDGGILASSYQRIALRMDYGIAILSRVIELVVLGNGDTRKTRCLAYRD